MADWSQEPAWLACRRANLLEFLSDVVTLGLPMSLLGRSLSTRTGGKRKAKRQYLHVTCLQSRCLGQRPDCQGHSLDRWTTVDVCQDFSSVRRIIGQRKQPVGLWWSGMTSHWCDSIQTHCCAPSCPTALHLFGGWPRESTPNKEMWITGGAFQIVNWYVASQGQP